MNQRIVVSGLGVVAPNANTTEEFERALRCGRSGIRKIDELEHLNFACQIGGRPEGYDDQINKHFDEEARRSMNSNITHAVLAGIQAWESGRLTVPDPLDDEVDWDSGVVMGTGIGGLDIVGKKVVPLTDAGKVRRLGSTCVEQVMSSNVSAKLGGVLALGNQVTTNSSACSTGTEAIVMAAERIRCGAARRMLAGGSEGYSAYTWAGFDSMRVTARGFNDDPERASRPMSATAVGFVPGCGAGVLLLETLESALAREATIYAEYLGGSVNCGGHRMGGSMTAPNPTGVRRCIESALSDADIEGGEVDAINGHLTATFADPHEINNWASTVGRQREKLPYITATKSVIGHGLGAAGAMESVGVALMLHGGFLHGSLNCDDLHSEIAEHEASIVRETTEFDDLRTMVKASFGFGDVNACVVFRHWEPETIH